MIHLMRHGERHPNSKLNDEAVRAIRLNEDGETQEEMAVRYDVTQPVISGIVLGKTWRHVND